jgi:hypothetical protein
MSSASKRSKKPLKKEGESLGLMWPSQPGEENSIRKKCKYLQNFRMEGILKNRSLAEERNKRDMIVSFLFHRDRNMLGKTRLFFLTKQILTDKNASTCKKVG